MSDLDFNLLGALDVLLQEGSVSRAARKLGLSASAMSRTLTRLRAVTGDPLLVRAGRDLVPTPRALELRDPVHGLTREVRSVLGPQSAGVDPASIDRTFTLRASEGFVQMFSVPLVAAITTAAPLARLRFLPKPNKNVEPLREGQIDLEIGVLGASAPEIRTRLMFRDRFVGAARIGHPLFASPITAERYAACRHVAASRRGTFVGPVDSALAALGLKRETVVVVPTFFDALRVATESDLVALVPQFCFRVPTSQRLGISAFKLPVATPEIAVLAMWHPRLEADPVHKWLRHIVSATCDDAMAAT